MVVANVNKSKSPGQTRSTVHRTTRSTTQIDIGDRKRGNPKRKKDGHVVFDEMDPTVIPAKKQKTPKSTEKVKKGSANTVQTQVKFNEGKQLMQMAVDTHKDDLFNTESSNNVESSSKEESSESGSESDMEEGQISSVGSQISRLWTGPTKNRQFKTSMTKCKRGLLNYTIKWKKVDWMVQSI